MATTFNDILDKIHAKKERTVVVSWRGGPIPDLSKETWVTGITNEEPAYWKARDRGLITHFVFDVSGVDHARRLYYDLCDHFKQRERRELFRAVDVNTGRRMFFLVKVTLGS